MDLWPTLPIIVIHNPLDTLGNENIEDTIDIASAKYRDRITRIHLRNINDAELEYLEAVMQEPFPALRHFCLECHALNLSSVLPPLPDTFLGGSTPCLRSLILEGVSFPTLPRFALSATHIVELRLLNIPPYGYILPEAMATCLSALPKLEYLSIEFRTCPSFPHQISPPRTTRAILPALTSLWFRGLNVREYFEDFVTRIDTPQLNLLIIGSVVMNAYFDIPRLHDSPRPFDQAELVFARMTTTMILRSPDRFELQLKCECPCSIISSMMETFGQQLPHLSHVEQLKIRAPDNTDRDFGVCKWPELFDLFITVQRLYVSKNLVPYVADALQDLTGKTAMEVFPALHNLSLEGFQPSAPVQEGINSFVAARQLSDHPIVIQCWEPQSPDDYVSYDYWSPPDS